jgi:hypothetical protein
MSTDCEFLILSCLYWVSCTFSTSVPGPSAWFLIVMNDLRLNCKQIFIIKSRFTFGQGIRRVFPSLMWISAGFPSDRESWVSIHIRSKNPWSLPFNVYGFAFQSQKIHQCPFHSRRRKYFTVGKNNRTTCIFLWIDGDRMTFIEWRRAKK